MRRHMKHMMIFELIDHVDGSFESELEGWEHAQAVANGRVVRLVQSRQIYAAPDDDEIGQKVKMVDLLGSKLKIEDDGFSVSEQMLANRSAHFVTLICLGLCFSLFFAAKSCHGATITHDFVRKVAVRESGNNPKARGKAGEVGPHQLKAVAVKEVNRLNGTKWRLEHAKDPELSGFIAYAYLQICLSRSNGTAEGAYRVYRGLR